MLSIVIPLLNQHKLAKRTINFLKENKTESDTEIIVIDNGSDVPFECEGVIIKRFEVPVGNYPAFALALKYAKGDVIAMIHSDLFIYEKGFDKRIQDEFNNRQKLGLLGFIGSNEIDYFGGRGGGTCSNFQGKTVEDWHGSSAEVHGRRITGFVNGAVVDGCVMIFRRKAMEEIGCRDDFPIHHFYDRLMCCQMLEKGWEVGILGVEFDHISGQTANQEGKYHAFAQKYMADKYDNFANWKQLYHAWWASTSNPSRGHDANNPDNWLYLEAERLFLKEYREEKHLIPKIV